MRQQVNDNIEAQKEKAKANAQSMINKANNAIIDAELQALEGAQKVLDKEQQIIDEQKGQMQEA